MAAGEWAKRYREIRWPLQLGEGNRIPCQKQTIRETSRQARQEPPNTSHDNGFHQSVKPQSHRLSPMCRPPQPLRGIAHKPERTRHAKVRFAPGASHHFRRPRNHLSVNQLFIPGGSAWPNGMRMTGPTVCTRLQVCKPTPGPLRGRQAKIKSGLGGGCPDIGSPSPPILSSRRKPGPSVFRPAQQVQSHWVLTLSG